MAVPTLVNVVLALEPKVVIAPMQTTIISANITAYSTAVGPSSFFRKFTIGKAKRSNMVECSFFLFGDEKHKYQKITQYCWAAQIVDAMRFREHFAAATT
jgi:hypothetical protein